eukprot:scaffold40643_cov66-Phaeocystis_antarctica.AAC.2
MDTSSTTSARHARHRPLATRLFCTRLASSQTGSWARPTPAKECSVVPPMWQAAMPVLAATKTFCAPCIRCSARTTKSRVNDLPVPAPPVRKNDAPCRASSTARSCIALSFPVSRGAAGADAVHAVPCSRWYALCVGSRRWTSRDETPPTPRPICWARDARLPSRPFHSCLSASAVHSPGTARGCGCGCCALCPAKMPNTPPPPGLGLTVDLAEPSGITRCAALRSWERLEVDARSGVQTNDGTSLNGEIDKNLILSSPQRLAGRTAPTRTCEHYNRKLQPLTRHSRRTGRLFSGARALADGRLYCFGHSGGHVVQRKRVECRRDKPRGQGVCDNIFRLEERAHGRAGRARCVEGPFKQCAHWQIDEPATHATGAGQRGACRACSWAARVAYACARRGRGGKGGGCGRRGIG